jgi:hypothetical protein
MDESLPDCINAAGLGVIMVSMETISEDREVPAMDLNTMFGPQAEEIKASGTLPDGTPIPMKTVPFVLDKRYLTQRISPSDFLWPLDFNGSNFDNAPWVGRTGRITWDEAITRFKLDPAKKEKYIGESKTPVDKLTHDIDKDKLQSDNKVEFDELFYKEHVFDSTCQSYNLIHHLVFINDEVVLDEPWKGQKPSEQGGPVLGSKKFPIRVLTLAYITDEAIPPSDSAIGRNQVDELNKSRRQKLQQRERSIPVRWFDVNRLDTLVQQGLMRGTWQHMIPVQGDGSRILGEVSRAEYPKEDFTFDQIAKSDLAEAWTIGPNQMGSGQDVETKGESTQIAQGFQTRVGRERAKVAAFFVGIAEVLGGLLAIYEDPSSFGEGFDPAISNALSYSILADSTVLVDAQQRLERLNQFVNVYAKSGWVVLEPVLKEIATLSGLDPNAVIQPPPPKPPAEPNVSIRLTGSEDLTNPLALAMLINSGQAPKPEQIEQARQLIQQAVVPPPNPAQPQDPMGGGTPQAPPLPPPGSPMDVPPPAPPAVGDAHPDMTTMPKITKRSNAPVEES